MNKAGCVGAAWHEAPAQQRLEAVFLFQRALSPPAGVLWIPNTQQGNPQGKQVLAAFLPKAATCAGGGEPFKAAETSSPLLSSRGMVLLCVLASLPCLPIKRVTAGKGNERINQAKVLGDRSVLRLVLGLEMVGCTSLTACLSCQNGDVCISILHPPVDDPQSGELPSERWNPTQNVR